MALAEGRAIGKVVLAGMVKEQRSSDRLPYCWGGHMHFSTRDSCSLTKAVTGHNKSRALRCSMWIYCINWKCSDFSLPFHQKDLTGYINSMFTSTNFDTQREKKQRVNTTLIMCHRSAISIPCLDPDLLPPTLYLFFFLIRNIIFSNMCSF